MPANASAAIQNSISSQLNAQTTSLLYTSLITTVVLIIIAIVVYFVLARIARDRQENQRFALGVVAGAVVAFVLGSLLGSLLCGVSIGLITKGKKRAVLAASFIVAIIIGVAESVFASPLVQSLAFSGIGIVALLAAGILGVIGGFIGNHFGAAPAKQPPLQQ